MHQLLHNMFPHVLSVRIRTFAKIDHDATRNVIDVQSAATRPYLLLAS
jgi:hypothetical protein